jgi:type III pantothenate kinase
MILAVDIGNTTITAGLVSGRTVRARLCLSSSIRKPDALAAFFSTCIAGSDLASGEIETAVVSCVVPPLLHPVTSSLQTLLGKSSFLIQPGIKVGMQIHYKPPGSLGSDRVVNAFATKVLYGCPAICIDFGTATTFGVLNRKGDFVGGAILPGLHGFSRVLPVTTSLLPETAFKKPSGIIGRSTVHNIQSGLYYGYVSMIEGMIGRIRQVLSGNPTVIATGGNAGMISNALPEIDVFNSNLTLLGLEQLYQYNQNTHSENIWPTE